MGRHQDYFTTPAVSQTSLFRHLQICILALLSARVLTLWLAFPGLSDASAGLGSTFLGLGDTGIAKRQESEPEEHSCFSISTFSVRKSLSTNHLIHVDKSVQTLKRYNSWEWGKRKDCLPHTLGHHFLFTISLLWLGRFWEWGQRQKLGDVSEARWWVKTWPLGLSGRLGLCCLWDPLSCKGVN